MHIEPWQFFLILVGLSLVFQGYFTMMEMAILSFNRVRLQYYISQGNRKAIWLGSLLARPTYLFGTTLIGVNLFLQLGSEASRLFYVSIGLNPDLAMITQIILVMVFAELAPMFAARLHPEHVVRIGITPIYFLSKVLIPFIWILNGVCRLFDLLFKSPPPAGNYLTRDELQKTLETKDSHARGQKEFESLVESIFLLKGKSPKDLMTPLARVQMASYDSTAGEVKELLTKEYVPYIPLFYHNKHNIFGVFYTRDLIRLPDEAFVRERARSPWFITEKNSIFQTIKQFRWNNQHFAVVLDENGGATGVLTLDRVIDEIFETSLQKEGQTEMKATVIVDRAFPANSNVLEINQKLGIELPLHREGETLEDLMQYLLGHVPEKSESVYVRSFELKLERSALLEEKIVRITSK